MTTSPSPDTTNPEPLPVGVMICTRPSSMVCTTSDIERLSALGDVGPGVGGATSVSAADTVAGISTVGVAAATGSGMATGVATGTAVGGGAMVAGGVSRAGAEAGTGVGVTSTITTRSVTQADTIGVSIMRISKAGHQPLLRLIRAPAT